MTTARLIAANLRRNLLRTALTGTAVTLAVTLVCLLLTMPAGLDALLDRVASNTRISVHNRAGIVYSMPYAFVRRVRQVDGVVDALASTWLGGTFEEAGRVTFPSFALEVDHLGGVYPDYEIAPEQLADLRRYRDGAIVGRSTLERYGWKIGDRVTLGSTVWPVTLDFRIVGEIPRDGSPTFWMNREYLDQALRAQGGDGLGIATLIWARVDDPSRTGAVIRTIDALSRNSDAETASETEKAFIANFFGTLESLATILLIVTALVALCIVFIAGNTASMGIRERATEIAVLRAMGFGRRRVFALLLAETLLLATASGLLGVALALAATRGLQAISSLRSGLGPLGSFVMTPEVIVQGILLSLGVGLVAGLAPAWGAVRRPVVETLHEVV